MTDGSTSNHLLKWAIKSGYRLRTLRFINNQRNSDLNNLAHLRSRRSFPMLIINLPCHPLYRYMTPFMSIISLRIKGMKSTGSCHLPLIQSPSKARKSTKSTMFETVNSLVVLLSSSFVGKVMGKVRILGSQLRIWNMHHTPYRISIVKILVLPEK